MKQILLLIFCCVSGLEIVAQEAGLDTSFGNNGKVTTGLGSSSSMAYVTAVQPDGKIIAGGAALSSLGSYDFALARYNSDGSLDTSFGQGGRAVTAFPGESHYIQCIKVLQNSKIVVVGTVKVGLLTAKSALVRYHSNGTLDTGFGDGGKVLSDLFPYSTFSSTLAVQPDGKLVVTGVRLFDGDPNYYLGLERYTEDGVRDGGFGTNGQVVASFGPGRSLPSTVALQADGKIVVSATYDQSINSSMAMARFNANGSPDTGFDSDGKLTVTFGTGTVGTGMAVFINASGKLVMAGGVYNATTRNFGVVQLNSNGSYDTTYDGDGRALSVIGEQLDYSIINSISRQADGKFLVTCQPTDYTAATTDLVVRRFNSNATLDHGFGTNGKLQTAVGSGRSIAYTTLATASGVLYIAGVAAAASGNESSFAIAKVSAGGVLDPDFDVDGKVVTAFELGNDRIKTLLVLPDSKLIAVGTSAVRRPNNARVTDVALSKYNPDGTLDGTFGTMGKARYNSSDRRYSVTAAALQADGKILVSCNFSVNTNTYEVVRFLANGSLDGQFGNGGKIVLPFAGEVLISGGDGKILVGGMSSGGPVLNRYTSDGAPDTTFGGDGSQLLNFAANYAAGLSIAVQPDGRLILSSAGYTQAENSTISYITIRINSDGSTDTSFGSNGRVSTPIHDVSFSHSNFVQPDGKIIVAGKSIAGATYFSSVRYLPDGLPDTTYGSNGVASWVLPGDYKDIAGIVLQADGKLVAALTKFNAAAGSYDFKVRRFDAQSMGGEGIDSSSGMEASFYGGYDEAFSVALQPDNKIVLAGSAHNTINEDFALLRINNSILESPEIERPVSGIRLYPNPVHDTLCLELPRGMGGAWRYAIFSVTGQLFLEGPADGLKVDTSSLGSGIYILKLSSGAGSITKKFVKE